MKIHEFEKYLDCMDDYDNQVEDSSENDNNESDYDRNNGGAGASSGQDNLMRKNSISVTKTVKPRDMDLFSPSSIIKMALGLKLSMQNDDPIFKYEYHTLVLKDRDLRKKIYAEIKACKSYYNNTKKRVKNFSLDEKTMKQF